MGLDLCFKFKVMEGTQEFHWLQSDFQLLLHENLKRVPSKKTYDAIVHSISAYIKFIIPLSDVWLMADMVTAVVGNNVGEEAAQILVDSQIAAWERKGGYRKLEMDILHRHGKKFSDEELEAGR